MKKNEKEGHTIDSRYVDSERRTELLQKAWSSMDGRQGGTDLRNLSEKAIAKNEK